MQSASGATLEKRYWAFISYSHSDTKETEWLHKALENFKIPPSLVGTESRTGVVPKRIFPVFRDRDELPTSADLGANLHSALRNARYLVVVCSPRSAKSIWVNAEVEYFKKTHGNSNVLCLIVGGTPGGTGEGEDAECFCPALRHHINPDGSVGQPAEPIAADLRENKDGRLRAFLKIVAGFLGVDFDALYQRERRRQRQRLLVLAGVVCVLAAIGLVFYQRLDTVAKSQNEIASEVKKMRDMKFREFGKLPEARAKELEKIIVDSGVLDSSTTLQSALKSEQARFNRYAERLNEFAKKRDALVDTIEAFISSVRPQVGWADAAKVLSKLEENSGMSEGGAINMLNANFSMANTMGRTSSSPKMQAEFRTWSEALQISESFSGKFEAAQKLSMQMNASQRIIPPDFEVGSTEPQPGRNPAAEHAKFLNSAAWILATDPNPELRDPKAALEFAKKACDLTGGKNAPALDTLAVAFAANGDFDSALRWQSQAIERGANESADERAGFLQRYKLYEARKPYIESTAQAMERRDVVVCIANPSGFDAWAASQRSNLERLESAMRTFAASPEEKVVIDTELAKLKEAQVELEFSGSQQLNGLRRTYAAQKAKANGSFGGSGYAPVPAFAPLVTVSEKVWRKPTNAPERGSLRESTATIMGPDGTQTIVKVDREGSAELYCIKKFVFTTPDGKKLDTQTIAIARQFARSSASFLGVHLN
jgi:tetratricopeptide (TPR) repeat protein